MTERPKQPNVNANPARALANILLTPIMDLKHLALRTGLSALSMSGAARLMAVQTRGLGAIMMFHHVRPALPKAFDPHAFLTISPEFLDRLLGHVKAQGYAIIPMDEVAERLADPRPDKPFVALTFDDGYRDTSEHALPVLKRHNAPFTVFATTGFAEAIAPLWWLDLEEAVESHAPSHSPAKLMRALKAFYKTHAGTPALQAEIARLAADAKLDTLARTSVLCLDWDGLRQLASEPLCSIGAHTITHPLLGPQDALTARREMALSKTILEEKLQRPIRHIAYPVGDALAAGQREFALAAELGYETGVTTRPGVLYGAHAAHLHALPRLSVNGRYQSLADLDVLLSGSAFWLLNRGRKLNVA